jgi:hypothetical protein
MTTYIRGQIRIPYAPACTPSKYFCEERPDNKLNFLVMSSRHISEHGSGADRYAAMMSAWSVRQCSCRIEFFRYLYLFSAHAVLQPVDGESILRDMRTARRTYLFHARWDHRKVAAVGMCLITITTSS